MPDLSAHVNRPPRMTHCTRRGVPNPSEQTVRQATTLTWRCDGSLACSRVGNRETIHLDEAACRTSAGSDAAADQSW